MTHPALALLIGPEFDEFLCAPIGDDRNGTGLSVLSALARLNVDPWLEATSLARMPREAAVVRLTALIDALPNEGTIGIPTTIAADLVALLPRGNSLNVRSSVGLFAPAGPRQTQILMALSALAIMTLIVLAISAVVPVGPGIGENPLPPRANDATNGYAAPIKTGSELLGRPEQTEDRIPVILIEKADRSPRMADRSKATSP